MILYDFLRGWPFVVDCIISFYFLVIRLQVLSVDCYGNVKEDILGQTIKKDFMFQSGI